MIIRVRCLLLKEIRQTLFVPLPPNSSPENALSSLKQRALRSGDRILQFELSHYNLLEYVDSIKIVPRPEIEFRQKTNLFEERSDFVGHLNSAEVACERSDEGR